MKNLKDQVALVTGGNRGIGLEVSRQLAKKGLKVILTSRDAHKGKEAVDALAKEGLDLFFHPLDVTDDASVDQIYRYVMETFGRLDILVNNAGIFLDSQESGGSGSSALRANVDTLRRTMETNVYGPFRLTQKFLPTMLKSDFGRVVNVSSGMGQLDEMSGGWPGYRISKTALNAVTKVFSEESKGKNILINSVCPGWVKTDMGGPEAERTTEEGADTIVWLATLPDGSPTGGFYRDRERIPW